MSVAKLPIHNAVLLLFQLFYYNHKYHDRYYAHDVFTNYDISMDISMFSIGGGGFTHKLF